MAHVFISYSKKHRPLTERIAALLERQGIVGPDGSSEPLTVWWDKSLLSGDVFHREITREIDAARAVVVIWSEDAVASDWVYAEAQLGASQLKLVPLRETSLDWRKIPLPYSALHTDDADNESAIIASVMARLGGRPCEDVRDLGAEQSWLLDPKTELPLERMARISPALLLQAKHRVAPFIDVDGRLSGLIDWALGRGDHKPQKTAGRVIRGPGGIGKTRLLIEVVSELANEGWLAGFVNRGALCHPTRGPQLESLVRNGRDARGLLVVVDYAEGRSEEVKVLSRLMIERERAGGAPGRLVLLSRATGDWWRDLSERDPYVPLVFGIGEETMDTKGLADIAPGDARIEIWRKSADALKSRLLAVGHSEVRDLDPASPPPSLADRLQAVRDDPDYARPLAIQMEALLWLRGASPGAGEHGVPSILKRMVGLEHAHWAKVMEGVSKIELDRGVAQVTAVQGVEGHEQAIALLKADSAYFGARTTEATTTIVRELAKLYGEYVAPRYEPGESGTEGVPEQIAALEPDLVGEHHVVSLQEVESLIDACLVWAGDNTQKRRNILTVLNRAARPEHGAEAERATELLDRLVRDRLQSLAADMVAVMVEAPGALALRLGRQVDTLDDEALDAIETALPLQSLSLMELLLRIAQRRVDLARVKRPMTQTVSANLAARLVMLGVRLSNLGRREEALAASQEAVDIYRRLAESQPAAFLPDLAKSLNSLGADLSDLGRREEALAASQEAVDIRRRLAGSQLDDFLPDLAMSLTNLSIHLSDLGRRGEALAASQEAVNIYRRLAGPRPDDFLPGLAGSLHNLGIHLSNLGRRKDALAASQGAVDIRRRLAETRPDAFLPDLVSSLINLGLLLSNLGRREEALAASQEAVGFYRRIAETRPAAFLPHLAMSLNNLGVGLLELGRREQALAASQEAVDIRRRLAQTRPDAFLVDLARSLNNLGNNLSSLGRREEALAASQEAVNIHRRLAETRPDAFLADLATSLSGLGNKLSDLGRREEALAASREAVDIYRRLAESQRAAFLPSLATSLGGLGNHLSDLGRREEALAASREAVDIYRRLAESQPAAFLPNLAGSLHNLGRDLSKLGNREEALAASQEAVGIYRPLAGTQPAAFLPNLASSLNSLSNDLSNLGHREEALAASQEAVGIYRPLAETRPDAFLPNLASSLSNHGNRLFDLGRREEALAASREAVDINRRLAESRPDAFLPDLAMSLNNLGSDLSNLGRHHEALAASKESVDINRRLAESRPEALLPRLAMSLSGLGWALAKVERHGDAAAVTHEGLAMIAPFVERHAQAFGDVARTLAQRYVAACENAGARPDVAMLERVARALGGR